MPFFCTVKNNIFVFIFIVKDMIYTVKDKYKDLVLQGYNYSLGELNSKQIASLSQDKLKKYFKKKNEDKTKKTV